MTKIKTSVGLIVKANVILIAATLIMSLPLSAFPAAFGMSDKDGGKGKIIVGRSGGDSVPGGGGGEPIDYPVPADEVVVVGNPSPGGPVVVVAGPSGGGDGGTPGGGGGTPGGGGGDPAPKTPSCGSNQHQDGDSCVDNTPPPPACNKQEQSCGTPDEKNLSCGPNQHQEQNRCEDNPPPTCGSGQHLDGSTCVNDAQCSQDWGKICRALCWAGGGVGALACSGLTEAPPLFVGCAIVVGGGSSLCSDNCPASPSNPCTAVEDPPTERDLYCAMHPTDKSCPGSARGP